MCKDAGQPISTYESGQPPSRSVSIHNMIYSKLLGHTIALLLEDAVMHIQEKDMHILTIRD